MKSRRKAKAAIMAIFALLFVIAGISSANAAWYDNSWGYRKNITLNQSLINATFTDFPILVSITDSGLATGALANGSDILFTDSNGTTKLQHEIEFYNSTTGQLVAWVKIPLLNSSINQTVYIYYGKSAAADQSNKTGVWPSTYMGVYHLGDSGTKAIDSTSSSINGTKSSSAPNLTTGKIGKGMYFDGTNHNINLSDNFDFVDQNFTICGWANPDVAAGGGYLAGKFDTSLNEGFYLRDDTTRWYSGVDQASAYYGTTIDRGLWQHVCAVIVAVPGTSYIFMNATQIASSTNVPYTIDLTTSMWIGDREAGDRKFKGYLDEVRFISADLSLAWIKTEYNNQHTPSSFHTLREEEAQESNVPAMNTSRIDPTPYASPTQTLVGYCNATDVNSDQLVYQYQWYKNGAILYFGETYRNGSISSGDYHTCGILTNGTVKCWGLNTAGELGIGNTTQMNNPTAINDTSLYVQISAGGQHTCGILTNGTAKCWGYNSYGQIGNGTNGSIAAVFALNPQIINDSSSYIMIAAGSQSTCGVLSNRTVKCWGDNGRGQLGIGNTTQMNNPTAINDTSAYTAITSGALHTCGILNNGTAKCWGYNSYGQIGNGTNGTLISVFSLNPQIINDTSTYSQISAGGYHTCGILNNGTAKCWGLNSYGQTGNGTNGSTVYGFGLNPQYVNDTSAYAQISGGGYHTCGILNNGTAKCWGLNSYGQTGNGTNGTLAGEYALNPQNINDTSTYDRIDSGWYHTCAIPNSGFPRCWGLNGYGQIGNGTNGSLSTDYSLNIQYINDSNNYLGKYPASKEIEIPFNITTEITSSGENWTLGCRAFDGRNWSGWMNSTSTVVSTCTYPGSGNWNVYGIENCIITTDVNLHGYNLTINGPGNLTVRANITNWSVRKYTTGVIVYRGT